MEFALLVDTAQRAGLDAVAQVDLGERRHRHQGDQSLGIMAAEIWQIALDRLVRATSCHDPETRSRSSPTDQMG